MSPTLTLADSSAKARPGFRASSRIDTLERVLAAPKIPVGGAAPARFRFDSSILVTDGQLGSPVFVECLYRNLSAWSIVNQ